MTPRTGDTARDAARSAREARLTTARERAWSVGSHPRPASAGRSRNMRAIQRSDTKPELAVRRLLHAAGLRYRVDFRLDLPGGRVRPDVAFTRTRLAVFIDSCFWHGCPIHGRTPTVNESYWVPKLSRNVARDRAGDRALEEVGWTVLRAWTHDEPADIASRVIDVARSLRAEAGKSARESDRNVEPETH